MTSRHTPTSIRSTIRSPIARTSGGTTALPSILYGAASAAAPVWPRSHVGSGNTKVSGKPISRLHSRGVSQRGGAPSSPATNFEASWSVR